MYAYYSQINPSHRDPNPILLFKEFSVVLISRASTPIKNALSGVIEAKLNRSGVALNNEHNIKLLRAQYIEHVVDRNAQSLEEEGKEGQANIPTRTRTGATATGMRSRLA